MGSIGGTRQERRWRAIEELRCHKVGILLQIIDTLEGMNLSVQEIETIFRACGLNDDCAMRLGTIMRDEQEQDYPPPGRPVHP